MREEVHISDILEDAASDRSVDSEIQATTVKTRPLLVFLLGELRLAVDANSVASVLPGEPPTKIPKTASYILGLIPYDEGALTVVDLFGFLDLDVPEKTRKLELSERRVIIVSTDELEAGLLCDKAMGVIGVEISKTKEATILKGGRLPEFLEYEIDTALGRVGILNLANILEAARVKT